MGNRENQAENSSSENSSENRRKTMRSVVAKLLNLAMHTGTPKAEADLAMQRATEIMAKYNIARHEAILNSKINIEDTMTEMEMDMYYSFKSQSWEAYLGNGIAKAFDCEILLKRGNAWGGTDTDVIVFMGNDEDVANVVYFFDYLQMLIAGEARQRYKKIGDKDSFGSGAAKRIGERLKELNERQSEILPTDTMALVVVKKGAVSTYVKKQYPNMGTTHGKRVQNGEAHRAGKAYGNSVQLSKGVGGSSSSPAQISG